jgi:aconitate hydratase 2/2-methylisocitrate dehydratase
MLKAYREHAAERAALGIPPLPLDAKQVADLIELIKNPPAGEDAFLMDLLTHRVPPGVDDAAKVKASFLAAVAHGDLSVALISKAKATELLGTMVGGYNVHPLIELLDSAEVAAVAAEALKKTLLMFDFFNDVAEKAKAGNAKAKEVMQSWAEAEWFTTRPEVEKKITVTVFKVPGETNTDDLSPAPDAWSRPDIPLHYLAMLKNTRPGAAFKPEEDGKRGPMQFIEDLKKNGHLVAYVGDVVGTGSSRKSATNSVIWATGQDIPFVPNKRFGGVTLGGKIAPIFFNTQEDSGALPIEVDVSKLEMGDVIDILPYDGKIVKNGATVTEFKLKSDVLFDEVRAGGRINLIIGRSLTAKARPMIRFARVHRVPPAYATRGNQSRLHTGPKNGRSCCRFARRPRRSPRHVLRTQDDHRGFTRHHRPDDPRRVERLGLLGLQRRHGDAVLLPHRCLPQVGGREDAPRIACVHQQPWRRGLASR